MNNRPDYTAKGERFVKVGGRPVEVAEIDPFELAVDDFKSLARDLSDLARQAQDMARYYEQVRRKANGRIVMLRPERELADKLLAVEVKA